MFFEMGNSFQQYHPSVPHWIPAMTVSNFNEKVAIIYYGWFTDPWTMEHEREHAHGKMHAY